MILQISVKLKFLMGAQHGVEASYIAHKAA